MPDSKGRVKASDIPDEVVLAEIAILSKDSEGKPFKKSVSRYKLHERIPQWPEKVLLAKLHSMVKRKKLDGCACGCSGSFWILGPFGKLP